MKYIKKIINVLTTLIIVIGGLLVFLYVVGIVPYVVLSGSMEPAVETGSLCFINKHEKINNIKEKDIIAFRMNDGTLVTHRVVEIKNKQIITKGDHNSTVDSVNITKKNFVGKNIFWIPKVGYIVVAFQSFAGRIILLTIIALLFILGFLFGDEKKENKK